MAKTKREPISPKTRLEVFKRDSFTCQYCGRKAPDVVLEIDHIKPVAKGGNNNIMNLITSCFECNRGKGKRELNDSSVIDKQHKQLELMQEKRNQLEMMIEWKEGLVDILDEEVRYFDYDIIVKTNGDTFSPYFTKKLRKTLKKIGFEIVFDAYQVCIDNFRGENKKGLVQYIENKMIGIAYNIYTEKTDPTKASLRHIANILKKNCTYFDYKKYYAKMDELVYSPIDERQIMSFARVSRSMDSFFNKVEEYYES